MKRRGTFYSMAATSFLSLAAVGCSTTRSPMRPPAPPSQPVQTSECTTYYPDTRLTRVDSLCLDKWVEAQVAAVKVEKDKVVAQAACKNRGRRSVTCLVARRGAYGEELTREIYKAEDAAEAAIWASVHELRNPSAALSLPHFGRGKVAAVPAMVAQASAKKISSNPDNPPHLGNEGKNQSFFDYRAPEFVSCFANIRVSVGMRALDSKSDSARFVAAASATTGVAFLVGPVLAAFFAIGAAGLAALTGNMASVLRAKRKFGREPVSLPKENYLKRRKFLCKTSESMPWGSVGIKPAQVSSRAEEMTWPGIKFTPDELMQFKGLPQVLKNLAASRKNTDIIIFCKEASLRLINGPNRNPESYKAAAKLIRHGLDLAQQANIDNPLIKRLYVYREWLKRNSIDDVDSTSNTRVAFTQAKQSHYAINNFTGSLHQMFCRTPAYCLTYTPG